MNLGRDKVVSEHGYEPEPLGILLGRGYEKK
jgi:hypothetical protein